MKLDILNINIEYKSELGEITKEGLENLRNNPKTQERFLKNI